VTTVTRHTRAATLAVFSCLTLALAGCTSPEASPGDNSAPPVATFNVTSTSIAADGELADHATDFIYEFCDGERESLQASWSDFPEGTVSFALKFENLTVDFVYWLETDISPDRTSVDQGDFGSLEGHDGRNSAGLLGYVGPCPEPNETHEYQLTIYALDAELDTFGLRPETFDEALAGHILGEAHISAWKSGPADA
jgi:hypothetical protein